MRERLLIPVLGLGQIVAFASSYYLLGILADPMAADLRTQPATMFSALSIAFLLSALITPTAGRAIERFGGRRVQAFAHAAFATALLIMASAISPEMLWVRDVFLLHRMARLTYEQIGKQLGMEPGEVQSHLAEALVQIGRAAPSTGR